MTLTEWLAVPNNTAAKLSRLTGLKPPYLSKLKDGKVTIGFHIATVLDRGTKGEIKAEDVCPKERELIQYLRGETV